MRRVSLSLAAALALSLTLSGCLGKLLGGGKPAQTYRLTVAALPDVPPEGGGFAAPAQRIVLTPVRFSPEIEGDRILATHGQEAMYIADARWLTPAPMLFEQAVRDRLRGRSGLVLLGDRRDRAAVDRILQITVDRFEARYDGPVDQSAPVIVIEGQATLFNPVTQVEIASLPFASTQPAASNQIEAIVAAFGRATGDAVTRLAGWTAINRLAAGDGAATSPDRSNASR